MWIPVHAERVENDFFVESLLAMGVMMNLILSIYLALKLRVMMKKIKILTEMSKAPKMN